MCKCIIEHVVRKTKRPNVECVNMLYRFEVFEMSLRVCKYIVEHVVFLKCLMCVCIGT